MTKVWLALATSFGFLSVALGAFGAHSLKNLLDEYGKSIYEKAVIYQMFHTLALYAVGLLQMFIKNTSLSIAGWCFLIGIFLFSGSLYLLALTGMKWFGAITPIGGISFLLGWAFLGFKIIQAKL
ncbi:MAG: hypothetical protein A2156_10775 [Deltaproteobacteria bacterium RBG_16_48_10]|nr:MAG: hypothetical protein A2156_10775 [Deltaproteobacteria bacterium RBG_16_48_10]